MARTKKNKPGSGQRLAAKNTADLSSQGPLDKIPVLHIGKEGADAKTFHHRFVSTRQPVKIQGKLQDLSFVRKNWANVEYLRKTAGDAPVKVEPMHKEKKRYGTDVERVDTTFGAFLDSLKEQKKEYDYLTTQYSDDEDEVDEEEDDEERDDKETKNGTFPQPVRVLLRKEVPLRPEIMGNLVLQQMNLWLGKSKSGTSSGLHHDFHDNLYVLLKGRKRFVLYPPAAVEHLNTYGKVKKIHSNGLIVYRQFGELDEEEDEENEGDQIRADGLVERDAAALRLEALEAELNDPEKELNDDQLKRLEKRYNDAAVRLTELQAQDFGSLSEDDFDEVEDDGDESEEDEELRDQVLRDDGPSKKRKAEDELDGQASKAAKGDDDSDEDSDADLLAALEKAKNGELDEDEIDDDSDDEIGDDESDADLLAALEKAENSELEEDEFDTANDVDNNRASASLLTALLGDEDDDLYSYQNPEFPPSEPLSFSQIPTTELHSHLLLAQPHVPSPSLAKAGKPYIVDLQAGDMLYLPTSWFHEVTSFCDGDDDGVHIALNYWFHPPDTLRLKEPYSDVEVWKFLGKKVEKAWAEVVGENGVDGK